jgi:hypothetical protein
MKFPIAALFLFFLNIGRNDAQNVLTVELQIPEEMHAGSTGTFNLEISKPVGMTSFASFSQVVPTGFSLKPRDLNGATFQFENNELIINWLRLPIGEKVNIAWDVTVNPDQSGKFLFGGTFNYFIDNSKGILQLTGTYLLVQKNNATTDNGDNTVNSSIHFNRLRSDVSCERKMVFNEAKKQYNIELILNGQIGRKYSIVEKIPDGYTFKALDNAGAELHVVGTTVQYLTAYVQPSKAYTIKYMLIPSGTLLNSNPPVYGKLSFIEDQQIINLSIIDKK